MLVPVPALRPVLRPLLGAAVLVAVLSGALVACGGDAAATGSPGASEDEDPPAADFVNSLYGGVPVGSRAPEFEDLGPWLNSEPLRAQDLVAERGVVLVDFWTYTCVNCVRTLPFLRDWHEKYAEHGLTIVGIHSPEFEFEKNPENVSRAVMDLGVLYPVAQDDDWGTWRAFSNNVWPAKYLVDASGHVVYRHFGEGDYLETEEAIRRALEATGRDLGAIPLGGVEEPALDPDTEGITRELYFGYERNYHSRGVYAAQDAYYDGPHEVRTYEDDPGAQRAHNQWYAHGEWRNEREGLAHTRPSEGHEDYVAFRFLGRTVNPVMHPPEGGAATVLVQLDGAPLKPEEAGPDVAWDAQGRSFVLIDEPRMYRVVELSALGDRVLALAPDAEGFAIYAVTFGAYTEGP